MEYVDKVPLIAKNLPVASHFTHAQKNYKIKQGNTFLLSNYVDGREVKRMSRIDELIKMGEECRKNYTTGNNSDFYSWITQCLLYLETEYKDLAFTKEFINAAETFKYTLSHVFSEENYNYMMESLKSVKKHEEYKKAQKEYYHQKINEFK